MHREGRKVRLTRFPRSNWREFSLSLVYPRERWVGVSSGGLDPMSSSYSRPCWQTLLRDIAPAVNRGSIQLTEELAFPSKFRARSLANLFEKISIPVSSLFLPPMFPLPTIISRETIFSSTSTWRRRTSIPIRRIEILRKLSI